jgi:hypothetical protein
VGFLSPWFLGGLLAVGLPVYLHLLRQHKSTPIPFSSLMFFEQRTQSSIKHRRLKYLLLLAMRLLLLMLLVLAFAQPYVERPAAALKGERLLMAVIDDSFSMRGGQKLETARREAASVLAGKAPGERAQVAALGGQLRLLTQPVTGQGELRAAVESIKGGDGRALYSELARALRSMAQTVKTPIEVHLFSDLQKSALPANFSEMALPDNVKLELHAVEPKAAGNWTLERVTAPAQLWDTKKARVQATVAGFGTEAATRTISLVVAGKTIATKTVQVPPGGRATAEFTGLEVPYGFTRCEARIDSADAMAADDKAFFAVERGDPKKVLLVHEARDTRSPLYYKAALGAAAEAAFTVETLTSEQTANIQPARYAFVVLSDVLSLPGNFEDELKKFVKGGGSVLIALGPVAARKPRVPVFDEVIREGKYFSREGERFLTVGESDPAHPSLRRAARWEGVKFYYAVKVDAGNSRVVAKLTDQTPLLLEKKQGEGRVLVVTSTFDNITNDFPLNPVFVPFVEQTARYLTGLEERAGVYTVGSFLELRSAREQSVSVEVIDPDGGSPLSLKERSSAQSFPLAREGYYELRRANGRHEMVAANADRRESDLSMIPAETLELWKGTGAGGGAAPKGGAPAGPGGESEPATRPYSLWWYVMLAAAILVVAESLLAGRYLGVLRDDGQAAASAGARTS